MKQKMKLLAVLLAALLMCQLLAGCGSESATEETVAEESKSIEAVDTAAEAETPEEPAETLVEVVDDTDISEFIGCWKYDAAPFYYVVGEAHDWMAINAYGDTFGPWRCTLGDKGLELYDDSEELFTVFSTPANGRSMDADGNTLSAMEYIMLLPTPKDTLNQTIAFPGDFSGISVNYPITMTAQEHPNLTYGLSFNARMEDGTDDYYSNIALSFEPVYGFDSYMTQGYATASKYLPIMLDQLSKSMYGNYLLKSIGSSTKDCGSYYSITGYLWLDGSVFAGEADAGTPVRATMEIRYYGPCGYVMVVNAVALESRIENYYGIATNIANSCNIDLGWKSAPKAVPANAESQKAQYSSKASSGKKNSSSGQSSAPNGSDSVDFSSSYYWYDEDGDIWFWNGSEDRFIGFGDDGYIDDDGQFYESNDAGWEYDDWNYDWDFFEDDEDIWSDDVEESWSDPGDYYVSDGWDDCFDDYDDYSYDDYNDDYYDDYTYDDYYDDYDYDDYDY